VHPALIVVVAFVVMAPWLLRLKESRSDEAEGPRKVRPPAVQNLASMRPDGP
jgi:flagellar biogenesis protein FliO